MQSSAEDKEGARELSAAFVLVLAVVFVSLSILYKVVDSYLVRFGATMPAERGDWGTLGDYVGGLTNPTFSFLALLVLLLSFYLQLREAKRNASALREQLRISQHEKFESTFFKLTDRLDAFSAAYLRARTEDGGFLAKALHTKLKAGRFLLNAVNDEKGVDLSSDFAADTVRPQFENYINFCRLAAQCLYFVDKSELSEREKEFYVSIYRDTFQSYELSLFLTLSVKGSPESVTLARKYKLAKHLKPTSFCSRYIADIYFGYAPSLTSS